MVREQRLSFTIRQERRRLLRKRNKAIARIEAIMNDYISRLRRMDTFRLDKNELDFMRLSHTKGDVWKWPDILRWYTNWGPYADPDRNPPGTYAVPESLVWTYRDNLEDLFYNVKEAERQLCALPK